MGGGGGSGGGGGLEDDEDVANLLQGDDYDGDGYFFIRTVFLGLLNFQESA